jgi:hypothetical protein
MTILYVKKYFFNGIILAMLVIVHFLKALYNYKERHINIALQYVNNEITK